jgi:hypothetical protein
MITVPKPRKSETMGAMPLLPIERLQANCLALIFSKSFPNPILYHLNDDLLELSF